VGGVPARREGVLRPRRLGRRAGGAAGAGAAGRRTAARPVPRGEER
jgi:hypothetical protein